MSIAAPRLNYHTVGDLLDAIGVPASRVRLTPPPGRATEQDWLEQHMTDDRPCELVAGTLVEKTVGYRESWLAVQIAILLRPFVTAGRLGLVAGADGPHRLDLGLIRLPDVAFVSWDRVPADYSLENPDRPYLAVAPDLAVEVLSESNTLREMEQKLAEYAAAGVRLVWYVDPDRRAVDVYPNGRTGRKKTFGPDDALDGGRVLPGLRLPVADIFAYPTRPGGLAAKKHKTRKK